MPETPVVASAATSAAAIVPPAIVPTPPAPDPTVQAALDSAAATAKAVNESVIASAPTVPDVYDLNPTLPDGRVLDVAFIERTATTARALGLSQEAATKLLALRAEDAHAWETNAHAVAEQVKASWAPGGEEWVKRDTAWQKQAKADPTLGATKEEFQASVDRAQQALKRFGSPELKTALDESGYGSHPAVIKLLAKVGKAMGESASLVLGQSGAIKRPKTDAEVMYPAHYTNTE